MLREFVHLGVDDLKTRRDKKKILLGKKVDPKVRTGLNQEALSSFQDEDVAVTVGNKEQTEKMRALLLRNGGTSSLSEFIHLAKGTIEESFDLSLTRLGNFDKTQTGELDDVFDIPKQFRNWKNLKKYSAELMRKGGTIYELIYKNEKGGISKIVIDVSKIDDLKSEEDLDLERELEKSGFVFKKPADDKERIDFGDLFDQVKETSGHYAHNAEQTLASKGKI